MLLQIGLHKLESVLARDHVDATDAVAVGHAIDLVCLMDDLQAEDKLTVHIAEALLFR